MSTQLDLVLNNQKPLDELERELDAIASSIDPRFTDQFKFYRAKVLGLLSDNINVAHDRGVQEAIAKGHTRVSEALSLKAGRVLDKKIQNTTLEASNDNQWRETA